MANIQTRHDFNCQDEKQQLENKISRVLERAKQKGVTQAEASAGVSVGFSTTVRMGEIETLEHHRDREINITVYLGHKLGSASTSDMSDESLEQTLEKAIGIAQFTAEDDCNGLADKELMANFFPDLKLYHPWLVSPQHVIPELIACEKEAMAIDKRLSNSEGASFAASEGVTVYGNTHGFIGTEASTHYERSLCLIAKEHDSMEREYDYTTSRKPENLESYSTLAKKVAELTLSRLHPRKIPTGKYPIIFHHEIATGLINSFFSAIRGGNLYRKSSFLLDSLGQQIFPAFLTLHENPHIVEGVASASFDAEGVATTAKDFIKNGIVQQYLLGSYSARKLKMKTTGNAGGIHNIEIHTPTLNYSELLKKMDTGFLVTEVMGQGVNLVTGDYSRGAAGFWIENGIIQYPVSEVTISGQLRDMFRNIIAFGNDIEHRSAIQTGSILLDEMMVAGK